MSRRRIALVIHCIVLEDQSEAGSIESRQPELVKHCLEQICGADCIVGPDPLDPGESATLAELMQITKTQCVQIVLRFDRQPCAEKVIVFIIDFGRGGEKAEAASVRLPIHLPPECGRNGISIRIGY